MSAPAFSGSRRLLASLRDVMAGSGTAQARLDKIVRLIAAEMVAEVCSCYVARPGEVLELFATVGLNPEAVHQTRLRVGEGLVGEVAGTAKPMAIANASTHPKFAYRPETGEDPYRSFLGVPLMRGGKVRGVLVIQNQKSRDYAEEEVETLLTIAMVVAEMVAGGDFGGREEVAASEGGGTLPTRLAGIALNAGLAIGRAVLHRPHLTVRQMVADDPEVELARFREAVAHMHSSLDDLVALTRDSGLDEERDILETYRMFAEDRGWLARITEAIGTGLSAEAAVQRVRNDMQARLARVSDPYLRERLADFEDLANRLLVNLAGKASIADSGTLTDDVVLVARNIGPAELLDYDRRRLRAVILEEGSTTSHVAIVARALEIPVIGRCASALGVIEPMDEVIVDGDNGQAFVRPSEDVLDIFQQAIELRVRQRRSFAGMADLPAETRDGTRIKLLMNAGLLIDLATLETSGAEGVGLYRTEIQFMVRSTYPDVAAQTELYASVLDRAGERPVVFRTLDIGGDKTLPYFFAPDEDNPALGWRALRMGLDRPAMLSKQLRALVRAAAGRRLEIMFPMVSEVAEMDAARALLSRELRRAERMGVPLPERVAVGAMVEVPALLWQLDPLLDRVDFIAVGSNDLLQYVFAADRGDPRIAQRYDTLSPTFLAILRQIRESADRKGKAISVCGEMASRPLEALALIGLGYRRLSVSAPAVGSIKAMVRSLDGGAVARFMAHAIVSTGHSIRPELRAFAKDHGVEI